ncbi:MAG: hypothetical protein ABJG42_24090 [Vibrio splendidus]
MTKEKLNLYGSMIATLVRENGDVEVTRKDNAIVTSGFNFIADAVAQPLAAKRPDVMRYIAVGRQKTAVTVGDTALADEVFRQEATYAPNHPDWTFTMSTTIGAGDATDAIQEAGVFNALAANTGVMLDRVQFDVINKGALDTLTIEFVFRLSGAAA